MSQGRPIAAAQVRDAAPLFAALGDETRIRLLLQLSSNGPEAIAGLTTKSGMSRQAITKHLTVLSNAGLVRDNRRGRERIWQLEQERFAEARDYIDRISRQWDEALGRLKHLVEG